MPKKKPTKPEAQPIEPAAPTCRIRLLVSRGGCDANGFFSQVAGEEIAVSISEAWSMFDSQQCEFVGDVPARPVD